MVDLEFLLSIRRGRFRLLVARSSLRWGRRGGFGILGRGAFLLSAGWPLRKYFAVVEDEG
jgi:hypothetical protein